MKAFILVILTFILIGCEETYQLETANFKPSIVVNSLFTNDSVWSVELTTSFNVFDPSSKSQIIDDAYVSISDLSGINICELKYVGNGKYESKICNPVIDKRYRLFVSSPQYGEVTATSSLPQKAKVTINGIDTLHGNLTVDFDITNNSQLSPHYIWDIVQITTTEILPDSSLIINKNQGLNINQWVTDFSTSILDIKLNGVNGSINQVPTVNSGDAITTSLTFSEIPTVEKDGGGNIVIKSTKNALRVITVSEELFNYYKSIENFIAYQEHQSSLSEPLTVYSNTKGGTGIFAGYTIEYIEIKK